MTGLVAYEKISVAGSYFGTHGHAIDLRLDTSKISNLSHAPLIGGWRLFKNLDATKKPFLVISQHIFCLYGANAENGLLTWVTIKRSQ